MTCVDVPVMRSMLLFRIARARKARARHSGSTSPAAESKGGSWTFRRFRRPPGGRRPVGELRRRAAAEHGGARCRSLYDALRTADSCAADTEVRSEESGDVQSGRHVIECAWAVDVAIEYFTGGAISCASNLRVAFCALVRKHNVRGTARTIVLVPTQHHGVDGSGRSGFAAIAAVALEQMACLRGERHVNVVAFAHVWRAGRCAA